ncbi:histidine kinase [Sphingomonas gellani]|uniref:histidine kinase n=1 Tax=Sphingomonas gellani TaxID=1166340 RepID=A0A1H8EQ02_9SPHN|nr:ATP-binding protein [Sphingomonas gellani]SEN21204.1 histidine kinase [Sphingomonas gellani]
MTVSHATVDEVGRLVAADEALLTLNERAGGVLGQPFALAPLAGVARLARRLGVIVSRSVRVAEGESDLELWVRAQPEAGQVRLAVSGWRAQQPWPGPSGTTMPDVDAWRWEADGALRLTHLSAELAAREGVRLEEVLGKPLTVLFTLEPDAEGQLPLVDALSRREPLHGQRVRLRGFSGRAAVLNARTRHDASGAFCGFSGTIGEVDDRPASADPALPEAFTQGLDRALRRPLTRIVANADSINAEAEGPIARDYADYAADIAGAGRHLLSLIDDLVDLQAIERPDFTLESEPLDLADLARRAAGLLSVRADDAGVIVDRPSVEATLPARGAFRRVLQILVNLIGNAVRYAPHGSHVSIALASDGPMQTVSIVDTGPGIAAEDASRIFDKFTRLDPAEAGGSGLGLYIARTLARAMGGDLTVESEPDRGARFTLALPRE